MKLRKFLTIFLFSLAIHQTLNEEEEISMTPKDEGNAF